MAYNMERKLMPRRAFTLIELLVVITIIVVLLALLTPALDKAIYQAELVQCGARLKAAGNGVTVYALGHKRYYPDRGIKQRNPSSSVSWIVATNLARPTEQYDIRPPLRTFMSINQTLQCPFSGRVELDNTAVDVVVEASYVMFWGWQYRPGTGNAASNATGSTVNAHPGMFKIGDRLGWEGKQFSTLIGDIDMRYPGGPQASHPDREPASMSLFESDGEVVVGARSAVSRWLVASNAGARGRLDNNFATDDGAVLRHADVLDFNRAESKRDKRMEWVPVQFDVRRAADAFQIPRT